MRNLIRYGGSGILTKLKQQDPPANWTKLVKDRAQALDLAHTRAPRSLPQVWSRVSLAVGIFDPVGTKRTFSSLQHSQRGCPFPGMRGRMCKQRGRC